MLDVEIQFISDHYKKMTQEELAEHLGVSKSTIKYHAKKLGLRKSFEWTDFEIEYLKMFYPEIGYRKIAKDLDRHHDTVRQKLVELGLR